MAIGWRNAGICNGDIGGLLQHLSFGGLLSAVQPATLSAALLAYHKCSPKMAASSMREEISWRRLKQLRKENENDSLPRRSGGSVIGNLRFICRQLARHAATEIKKWRRNQSSAGVRKARPRRSSAALLRNNENNAGIWRAARQLATPAWRNGANGDESKTAGAGRTATGSPRRELCGAEETGLLKIVCVKC